MVSTRSLLMKGLLSASTNEQIGHLVNSKTLMLEKTKIVGRESRDVHGKIVESIVIHQDCAGLNCNDRYNLPGIYFSLLLSAILMMFICGLRFLQILSNLPITELR